MRLPHLARFWLITSLIATVWVAAVPLVALAWTTPQQLPAIPTNIRRPHISGEGNRFHVVFHQDNAQELYYSRGTTSPSGAVSWEAPVRIATGVRYAWNVVAANGVVHVAYTSTRDEVLYIVNSQRGDPGAWSAPQRVATLADRANDLDIALDGAGTPYIAWAEGIGPSKLMVGYRTGTGAWVKKEESRNFYLVRSPQLVVSGSGDDATVHVMTEFQYRSGNSFYVGYTTGKRTGGLSTVGFSQSFANSSSGDKPTLALDPSSGTLYTGFVTGNQDRGYRLQFSYSLTNGQNWVDAGRQSLGSNLWADLTPLVADRGTAYLMLPAKQWTGNGFSSIGFYDIRYSLASNSFSAPQPIRDNAGTNAGNASPDYDFNIYAKVAIWVTGNTQGIAYNSDPGGRAEPISATLVLNNGAPATNNANVTIELRNVTGNPTQMRVALDGDPTAATPLEPFQASFTRTFGATSACQRTVAVQLYGASGSESEVLRANIIVDRDVQASTLVRNPYLRANIRSDSAPTNRVVDDGDPNYTREQKIYLQINGTGECSGLSRLRIGNDPTNLSQTYSISGSFFAGELPLPAPVAIGPNTVFVEVTDGLGNILLTSHQIIFDPNAPVLTTAGTLAVNAPATGPNILPQLVFSGNVVSDTIYPGRGFWGVWLANSRTPVADPANDPNLAWSAVAAPGSGSDFTLSTWSVLGGLPREQQTPGTYYVYARFLDGAGNPTSAVISGTVTLDELRLLATRLPVVVKSP